MKYGETPQDIQDLLMRMSPVEIAAAIHALFVPKVARTVLIAHSLQHLRHLLSLQWGNVQQHQNGVNRA